MRWSVVIRRYPVNLEYPDVPDTQLMGLIRGHLEDPRVRGVEVEPTSSAERPRHAVANCPPYPLAA